jgi:hypothetical protein
MWSKPGDRARKRDTHLPHLAFAASPVGTALNSAIVAVIRVGAEMQSPP